MATEPYSSKDERNENIARLVAAGLTQVQISERTGVSVRTIRRLQEHSVFRARVRAIRRERAHQIHARIAALQEEALEALADLLRHAESAWARRRLISGTRATADRRVARV